MDCNSTSKHELSSIKSAFSPQDNRFDVIVSLCHARPHTILTHIEYGGNSTGTSILLSCFDFPAGKLHRLFHSCDGRRCITHLCSQDKVFEIAMGRLDHSLQSGTSLEVCDCRYSKLEQKADESSS